MMTYREARELLTQSGRGANEAQDILDDLARKGPDYKGFSVKTESGVRWLRYSGLRAGSLQPEYTMREEIRIKETEQQEMTQSEQLRADLKLLVSLVPEEVQGDDSYYAAQRIYEFIDYHAEG
jgi:hypothetical protein